METNDYSMHFNNSDVKEIVNYIINNAIDDGVVPSNVKKVIFVDGLPGAGKRAVFLGGLPGGGKTGIRQMSLREMDQNAVAIDIDDYRKFHPKIDRIKEEIKNNKDLEIDYYAKQTKKFARQVGEGVKGECKKRGFNMIIEGTARKPENVEKDAKELSALDYDCSLVVIDTDKKTAWDSTVERYQIMLEESKIPGSTTVPRAVGAEYFNTVVVELPESISTIYKNGSVSRIRLANRNNEITYDSLDPAQKGINPGELLKSKLAGSIRSWAASERTFTPKKVARVRKMLQNLRDSRNSSDKDELTYQKFVPKDYKQL